MSKFVRRATITIDTIAQALFPQEGTPTRRYVDILAELQEHLQNEGDDPRYARVVFAVDGNNRFGEFTESHISLEGVFPRCLAVRYEYGADNVVVKNLFSANVRDTLVVVDSEAMAQLWERELRALEYEIRRMPPKSHS